MLKLDALVRREGKAHLEGHERRIVRQKAFAPGQQAHVIQQSCGGDRKMGTMGEKQNKQKKIRSRHHNVNRRHKNQTVRGTREDMSNVGATLARSRAMWGHKLLRPPNNEGSVSAVQLLACSA